MWTTQFQICSRTACDCLFIPWKQQTCSLYSENLCMEVLPKDNDLRKHPCVWMLPCIGASHQCWLMAFMTTIKAFWMRLELQTSHRLKRKTVSRESMGGKYCTSWIVCLGLCYVFVGRLRSSALDPAATGSQLALHKSDCSPHSGSKPSTYHESKPIMSDHRHKWRRGEWERVERAIERRKEHVKGSF